MVIRKQHNYKIELNKVTRHFSFPEQQFKKFPSQDIRIFIVIFYGIIILFNYQL